MEYAFIQEYYSVNHTWTQVLSKVINWILVAKTNITKIQKCFHRRESQIELHIMKLFFVLFFVGWRSFDNSWFIYNLWNIIVTVLLPVLATSCKKSYHIWVPWTHCLDPTYQGFFQVNWINMHANCELSKM